jgi:NADPH:quinone reductase-like Zn-dependent oxidoreductase
MKQFEIREFGIDNLALAECECPKPGAGEVLVRMRAASLNYRDYMAVKGVYNPRMRRPMVPLSDGAGVVEEAGAGVKGFKKGDRVATCFFQDWVDGPPTKQKTHSALGGGIDGVLREYCVFRQEGLIAAPSHLSDEETATLPCAALTAWHALFEGEPAAPGDSVLIQGTGGVSIFALQFATAAGLRPIVTSSSDRKLERAKKLGAAEVLNYKSSPEWDERAREYTAGAGVDRVVEVGGSDTIAKSLRAVRMNGVVSVIGVLSGGAPAVSPVAILMNLARLQGIYVGSRAMFERMNRAIETANIKPVIDKTFGWMEIKEALRYMEGQQFFGKICLRF